MEPGETQKQIKSGSMYTKKELKNINTTSVNPREKNETIKYNTLIADT